MPIMLAPNSQPPPPGTPSLPAEIGRCEGRLWALNGRLWAVKGAYERLWALPRTLSLVTWGKSAAGGSDLSSPLGRRAAKRQDNLDRVMSNPIGNRPSSSQHRVEF